jgi:TP901 family phage tail tape measure protein
MTRTGATLTSAVTLPLVGLGVLAVSQSIKIENAWNEVRATYNATPKEIERVISAHGILGKAVDTLSTKYGIDRVEVINLLGSLSQMGYTGKRATDTLKQGLEFAIAAGIPLQEGLQTTITLTSTFGLNAARMTEVLRGLNVIENDTAANGEDLAIALRRAGGNAAALVNPSFSAKDAIASIASAMAVFRQNGQETYRSANALRAIFLRLYSGGPKVNEFFKQMGVSVTEANGQLKPFPKLMHEIAANWSKLAPKDQLSFIRSSIGIEFAPLFELLIKDLQKGQKGMSTFDNSMKNFGDTAKGTSQYNRELEIRTNSLSTALNRVKAAFQKVVDQPGVRKAFKEIADKVAAAAKKFSEASPKVQKWTVIIGLIAAVVGPVLIILGALIAAVSAVGWEAFAIIGGIIALGKAFVDFMKKGGPVQDFVKKLAGFWLKELKGAWTDIKSSIQQLMPVLQILGYILGGVLLVAITVIVSAIRGFAFVLKWLITIVVWVVTQIVNFFKWLYNVLVGHSIIPDLVNGIIAVWNMLTGPIVAVAQWIANAVVAAWNFLKATGEAIWNGIVAVVQAVFGVMATIVTTQLNIIKAVWGVVWGAIKAVGQVIWTAIKAAVSVLFSAMSGTFNTGLAVIKAVWNTAWTAIKAFGSATWNAIKTVVSTAINVVKNLISAVMNAIKGNWSGAWNNIKAAASAVMSGIKSIVSGFGNAIKSTISSAINGAKSVWSTAWNAMKSTVNSVVGGIKSIVNSMVNAVTGAYNKVTSVLNNIKNKASNVLGAIPGFKRGGLVPGTGVGDTVHAMLEPGEYVLTKKAVRRIGLANLNRLQSISGGQSVLDAVGSDGPWSALLSGSIAPNAAGGFAASVSADINLPANLAKLVGGSEVKVEFNTIVNNPIAEKSSDSINRRMAKTAQLGLIDSALSGALN